jgi:hypothetical protein
MQKQNPHKRHRHPRLERNSNPGYLCLGDLSARRGQIVLKAKDLKFFVTTKYTVPTATYCPWFFTWLFSRECAVDLLEIRVCHKRAYSKMQTLPRCVTQRLRTLLNLFIKAEHDRTRELNHSQNRETVKYGHESRGVGTKDDCAGEHHRQFTRPAVQSVRYSCTAPRIVRQ